MIEATNDQIALLEKQLVQLKIENWLREDLFSPTWWLMLIILVIPWIIWWRIVDKNRILQITLLGMLVLIFSSYLDAIGSELALWQYNKMLFPLWSRLISVDFSVMPVTYMVIYQYFNEWRSYTYASIVIALLYAFVAEPMITRLGIYQQNTWSLWYSLAIYIILPLSIRLLVEKISAHSQK